jgi:hypothetical protein
MSQRTEILDYLQKGNAITPLEALKYFGCFRLAAVIHTLRERGHVIETQMVKHGEKEFASYRLA